MDWKDVLASLDTNDLTHDDAEGKECIDPGSQKSGAEPKVVTLFYERKGRGGKSVTILSDFSGVTDSEIEQLASRLKKALGTGGSCRGGEILIQGDRRIDLREFLSHDGFKVKG